VKDKLKYKMYTPFEKLPQCTFTYGMQYDKQTLHILFATCSYLQVQLGVHGLSLAVGPELQHQHHHLHLEGQKVQEGSQKNFQQEELEKNDWKEPH
jgi:hypothetical protein